MKLYKYTGTISEVSFRNRTACDIKLYDMNDRDKAPTRLEVFGALGKYILDIEGTDAEERYIPNVFCFDDNLYLWRIEIPGGEVGRPAKIITQSPDNIDQLEIFGQQDYIQTSKPEFLLVEDDDFAVCTFQRQAGIMAQLRQEVDVRAAVLLHTLILRVLLCKKLGLHTVLLRHFIDF